MISISSMCLIFVKVFYRIFVMNTCIFSDSIRNRTLCHLAKSAGKAYITGEPRFLRQQKPGLARRVTAPRTAASWSFINSPGPSRQWAGALCYLASDASNSTTAKAISETMIKRLMTMLLFWLAPRRAQAVE